VEHVPLEPFPREHLQIPIPQLLDAAAYRYANREAICGADGSFTYRDTQDLIDRVAHAILEASVAPGDRVLLLFGHRAVAFAAALGVVKSGAIAVPLMASTPADRLDRIARDAQPSCVVTDITNESHAQALARGTMPVIVVERLLAAAGGAGRTRPTLVGREWPSLSASDPAFIMYTSGSSGEPKGVVQTHRSVLQKIRATTLMLETTPADRIAMFSTYAVGQGLTAVFSALLRGGAVCQFDVRRQGLEQLARWLVEQRISIYISSATLFRSLVRTLDRSARFPDLRLIRLGSERVTTEDVDAYRRLFGVSLTHKTTHESESTAPRLLIAYSSTETANISMHFVRPDEQFPDGIVPVGRPSEGVTVSVVDESGQPLPPGEEGEIVVRSAYLPAGYWRDAERTAWTYLPVSNAPDERICRTGDLGRMRPDGCLEHRGRKDRRVKIRGYRVELEEVERVLSSHPSVAHAAVLARADRRGDPMLVAYLEMKAGASTPVEDIREYASLHLPDYMVPATFIVLDAMPTSDTGKINRSRLPDPPLDRPSLSAAYVSPRTALESTIAAIWRDVLGLDGVGVHDPLLMVGGDSLRAAQISSRLSAAVGVEVQLWDLLEASTIAGVAALVARATETHRHREGHDQ
jgi:amino acid adenylation domain-containing protein